MITKSNFTDYLTCNNLYYLKSILKEEYILSDFTKSLLEQGNEIGYLARGYFGDYVLVDATDNIEKVKQTEKYINEGQKVICEASFLFEDLFCQIDILRINDDGQYEIYEVKSSSKVQEYHLYDISFQTYVLKKLGLPVSSSYLVLLNNEYIKIGDLDLKGFFNLNLINEFKEVEEFVDEIRNMSELSSFKPCSDCSGCPYHSRCFKDLPKENIFNLAGLTKKNDLYNDGVITYDDYIEYVKRENKKGKLVNKILEQIEYERNDKGTKVNKKELRNFLDSLVYPLYYLDFETITETIPKYDGLIGGYVRVVQFSLHIKDTPTSELRHEEYLLTEEYDNREEVAQLLIKYLNNEGSIITYSNYETDKINKLKAGLPEYSDELEDILSRIVDLEKVFKDRMVYKKEMKGFSTIKLVLPAMCENFEEAYKELPLVHNGGDAVAYYKKMIESKGEEKTSIVNALLEYCCLDTLAMVEILNELYKLAE